MRRALVLAAALAALAAPAARANGDPASDELIVNKVFLSIVAPVSSSDRELLAKTVEAANERGYPIRVAVVTFSGDLGTATALWRHPQDYAKFLGSELAFVYTKRLLIAMPNGFGIYHRNKPVAKEEAVLRKVAPGTTPPELTRSAADAVRALAASEGITLPEVATGGHDWRDRLIIAAVGLAAVLLIGFVVWRRLRARGAAR